MRRLLALGLLVCAMTAVQAEGAVIVTSDKVTFLTSTGATSATGPLPDLGTATPQPVTVGSITFSSPPPSTVVIGVAGHGILDWTTLLPGNDIAINAVENLNMVSAAPVFAMGFDFVEPALGGSTTDTCFVAICTDSTFAVTVKNGSTIIHAFTFNAADDVAAFVGVWSSDAFDRLEIRELNNTIDDEFWGQVYTGDRPLPAVPAPMTLALLGAGLAGLGLMRRCAR
ncbi:MAG: PEP-CTERM sorting domain-containing protein [Candidatus Rokubacteria bacterium]|nr:PEP-CTERM sorting domain-containing protein [Candidatus Rokubacteria bacterium]